MKDNSAGYQDTALYPRHHRHLCKRSVNAELEQLKCHSSFVVLASLVWLIIRSGRKPTRLAYPCQQAAASVVLIAAAAAAITLTYRFRTALSHLFPQRITLRQIFLATSGFIIVVGGAHFYSVQKSWAHYDRNLTRAPIGIPLNSSSSRQPLFAVIPAALALDSPHRVVSVHSSNATSWTGSGNSTEYVNQEEVNQMVRRGILSLTGRTDYVEAWRTLIPYQSGEVVGIKLNCNNGCYLPNSNMTPYAELINAVIGGLVGMGVPANNIWLIDPSRGVRDPAFKARIENQGVTFSPYDGQYVAANSPYASLADFTHEGPTAVRPGVAFTEIDHLINMPQLKGHGGASITLGLKNHYGSAEIGSQGRDYWHRYFYTYRQEYGTNGINPLLAINLNPSIRNKTRLIVGDGLFGHHTTNYVPPVLFRSFGNNPPEILFFGVDPVAVDSVMTDYLQRECRARGAEPRNDDLNRDAANAGLGVNEHWDGDDTRHYSAIDYREIDLDSGTYTLGDVSQDGSITSYDAALTARHVVGMITLTAQQLMAADVSGDGGVSAYDAALIAEYAVGLRDRFPAES